MPVFLMVIDQVSVFQLIQVVLGNAQGLADQTLGVLPLVLRFRFGPANFGD